MGHEIWYVEANFFKSVYFTGYVSNRSRFNRSVQNSSHRGTTSINSCTSYNGCTISSSQYLYRNNSGYYWLHQYQVRVLVDDGYDSQASFLYWRFTDIKEWCQLKCKIPTSCSRISYGYMKIKYLQEMDWRVTDLMLRGKIIDLNHFETDILADAIEESWLDFEDTRYVKGGAG